MLPWGHVTHNMRRATEFLVRRRDKDGTRHLVRTDLARGFLARMRGRDGRVSALWLAWPGLLLGFIGLDLILGGHRDAAHGLLRAAGFAFAAILFVRAGTAPAGRFARVVGLLAAGVYPTLWLLARLGVLT